MSPGGLTPVEPSLFDLGQAATLDDAFNRRVGLSPQAVAHLQFDARSGQWHAYTWAGAAREVARWRPALESLGLSTGERVAIMLANRREWAYIDLAALGLGLVVVPVFVNDRADNLAWILEHADCRAVLIGGAQTWAALAPIPAVIERLKALISLEALPDGPASRHLGADWLPAAGEAAPVSRSRPDDLATLVYTSGTTGRPKGVMLSHRNILFLALGGNVLQGYGLTEASPVISVNRPGDSEPESVGQPLPGIQVRIGERQELLTRSPSVMLGFWKDTAATRRVMDANGWLHTGDQALISPRGHLRITGRIKDILVLSTGEKVSPSDLEQALGRSPLLEQVLVLGDGRPYLVALAVPAPGALDLAPARERAR